MPSIRSLLRPSVSDWHSYVTPLCLLLRPSVSDSEDCVKAQFIPHCIYSSLKLGLREKIPEGQGLLYLPMLCPDLERVLDRIVWNHTHMPKADTVCKSEPAWLIDKAWWRASEGPRFDSVLALDLLSSNAVVCACTLHVLRLETLKWLSSLAQYMWRPYALYTFSAPPFG